MLQLTAVMRLCTADINVPGDWIISGHLQVWMHPKHPPCFSRSKNSDHIRLLCAYSDDIFWCMWSHRLLKQVSQTQQQEPIAYRLFFCHLRFPWRIVQLCDCSINFNIAHDKFWIIGSSCKFSHYYKLSFFLLWKKSVCPCVLVIVVCPPVK